MCVKLPIVNRPPDAETKSLPRLTQPSINHLPRCPHDPRTIVASSISMRAFQQRGARLPGWIRCISKLSVARRDDRMAREGPGWKNLAPLPRRVCSMATFQGSSVPQLQDWLVRTITTKRGQKTNCMDEVTSCVNQHASAMHDPCAVA